MSAKPHVGPISEGTLKLDDLLRAYARTLWALDPQNVLIGTIDQVLQWHDATGDVIDPSSAIVAADVLADAEAELDYIADLHGLRFGAHPGDGACIGFWAEDGNVL